MNGLLLLGYSVALKDVWLGFHEESRDAFLLSLYPISLLERREDHKGEAFLSSSYWWFGGLNLKAGGSYKLMNDHALMGEIDVVSLGSYSEVDEHGNEIGTVGIMTYGFKGAYSGRFSFSSFAVEPVASLQFMYVSLGFPIFSFGIDLGALLKRPFANIGDAEIFFNVRNLLSDWMYAGVYLGYEFSLKNGVYMNSLAGVGSRVFSGFVSPEILVKSHFPVNVSKDLKMDGIADVTAKFLPSQDVPVEFRLFVGAGYSSFEAGFLMGSVGAAGLFYGVSGSMRF